MTARDPRVDAYIANSADFARLILVHLRDVVHRSCPQVEETLKWRMPTFMYRDLAVYIARRCGQQRIVRFS